MYVSSFFNIRFLSQIPCLFSRFFQKIMKLFTFPFIKYKKADNLFLSHQLFVQLLRCII